MNIEMVIQGTVQIGRERPLHGNDMGRMNTGEFTELQRCAGRKDPDPEPFGRDEMNCFREIMLNYVSECEIRGL